MASQAAKFAIWALHAKLVLGSSRDRHQAARRGDGTLQMTAQPGPPRTIPSLEAYALSLPLRVPFPSRFCSPRDPTLTPTPLSSVAWSPLPAPSLSFLPCSLSSPDPTPWGLWLQIPAFPTPTKLGDHPGFADGRWHLGPCGRGL